MYEEFAKIYLEDPGRRRFPFAANARPHSRTSDMGQEKKRQPRTSNWRYPNDMAKG